MLEETRRASVPVGLPASSVRSPPPAVPRAMSFGTQTELQEIGQYELVEKIAEGGMGAVYKGRHRISGRIVAIKTIPAETARNPVLLRRFEQEFRAASLIDHPNVVKALEYCGAGPTPFLVMEFVEGSSLGEKVEREGALPEEFAIHIIGQVCEGLHRAHKQGLIHRDVKPDNILVTAGGIAKLTDLGLVKDIEGEMNLTRTGKGLGTPYYMAPEQFRNAKNADVRCDIYSLGATLYMMVTGHVPFAKTSPLDCWMRKTRDDLPPPKSVLRHLSDRIDFAIRRAMLANPAERPANCREFMEDLTGTPWRPGLGGLTSADSVHSTADANAVWYMVYYDAGIARTVKGTTDTIRRNVQANTLGDPTTVLVSRTKAGPFAPLRNTPEFRDLLFGEGSGSGPIPPAALAQALGLQAPSTVSDLRSSARLRLNASANPDRTPAPAAEPRKTQAVESVPRTDSATKDMGTDERPKLVVEDPASYSGERSASGRTLTSHPEGTPRRSAWAAAWPWIAAAIGVAGFLVGLVSLLRG